MFVALEQLDVSPFQKFETCLIRPSPIDTLTGVILEKINKNIKDKIQYRYLFIKYVCDATLNTHVDFILDLLPTFYVRAVYGTNTNCSPT
jgi:hypothetical protein